MPLKILMNTDNKIALPANALAANSSPTPATKNQARWKCQLKAGAVAVVLLSNWNGGAATVSGYGMTNVFITAGVENAAGTANLANFAVEVTVPANTLVQEASLNYTMPADGTIYLRSWVRFDTTGLVCPRANVRYSGTQATHRWGADVASSSPAITAGNNALMTTNQSASFGTGAGNFNSANLYDISFATCIIGLAGAPSAANPSAVGFIGDSILDPVTSSSSALGFVGYMGQALGDNTGTGFIPFINMATNGFSLSAYFADLQNVRTMRLALAPYLTDIVLELGVNDLRAGRTFAQIKADVLAFIAEWQALNIRVHLCTITPNTTGTYTSDAGQTVYVTGCPNAFIDGGYRDQLNAEYLDPLSDIRATGVNVFPVAAAVESATDHTKWANIGGVAIVSDGLHPGQNLLAHTLMANVVIANKDQFYRTDFVAPTVVATVDGGGTFIDFNFNEPMRTSYAGLSITLNGASMTPDTFRWVTNQKLRAVSTVTIKGWDVPRFTYNPTTGSVQDTAGTHLAAQTDTLIINGSNVIGGDEMTVDETVIVDDLTNDWSDGLDGPITICLQPTVGDLYYQVAEAQPDAGAKGKFIRQNGEKTLVIPDGVTLYWRATGATGELAYDLDS